MDQHPMPRQITTFEFKLIGFLTLKQFIYLVIFIPIGFIFYKIFPIPIINIVIGVLIGCVGALFSFVPINERPLDVWIRNLFKRLTSPTQYVYHKHNNPIYFLKNLFFVNDPHRVTTHIESEEKLAAYLARTGEKKPEPNRKNHILSLFHIPTQSLVEGAKKPEVTQEKKTVTLPQSTNIMSTEPSPITKKPFFVGIVKNHKLIPIPGILIYVKDQNGKITRLLKTNPHGVFATFSKLAPLEYQFEFKDPKETYFFDTMKLKIEDQNPKTIEVFSKELI